MPTIPGYRVLRFLGEGATGKVYLARRDSDNQLVAIKRIRIDAFDPTLRREIYLMQQIGEHPNVIKLFETREIGDILYIIMEFAENGEFFDYVGGGLRQEIALAYFRQIVQGLHFIHSKQIAHRDLKLENVLMGPDYTAKICDFGFSSFFTPGQMMRTVCGSPPWVAPEILLDQGYEGIRADIWSLGVLLFAMVSAALPVCERAMDGDPYYDNLKAGLYGYEPWTTTLAQPAYVHVADLIKKMLNPEPGTRLTLDQVEAHPWFQGAAVVMPVAAEVTQYMSSQRQAGGGPVEATGSSTLIGGEDPSGEVFRGGLECAHRAGDDEVTYRGADDHHAASDLGTLRVYEEVTEGMPLPATALFFDPAQTHSVSALMMRLTSTLTAQGFQVTPDHDRRVLKAKKALRPGAECGLRVELYRTGAGRPLATVSRQQGDKMGFLMLWREFSDAMAGLAPPQ